MSSTARPKIDDEAPAPLEALTEALMSAGATTNTEVAHPEAVEEAPRARRHGPVVARTQALYNTLDMAKVAAADFIAMTERQIQEEEEDLRAQVEALTTISQRRVKSLMERRQDAVNELNAAELTMRTLTGQ